MKRYSFAALNLTQFLTALNDNLYKLLLIFLLISIKGEKEATTILALAGAIFVIPFLIFASPAGFLADRFSKQKIIFYTRIFEIFVVTSGLIGFYFEWPLMGYATLFLMATLSAFFSPCKYGILPEIVKQEKLSHYNGIITASTYLAIILGTFLASFLADITKKNYSLSVSLCLLVALTSLITSLFIEKTVPQATAKKFNFNFLGTLQKTFQKAKKVRYLFAALIFGSYFLFIGAFVQLNIIPFSIESLHQSEIEGGYLFLITAIGIGIGSYFAGKFSGREIELAFVPISALGITFVLALLYFFQHNLIVVVSLLVLVGFLGGFYIVPTDAFIQAASPASDRGQNVAAANFVNFLGVIVASGLIALFGNLLKIDAATGFLIVGIFTLFIGLALALLLLDQLLRFTVARIFAPFWNLKVIGKKNITKESPILLVANRTSWIDTLIVMAELPRLIRYIIPGKKKVGPFLRFLKMIPIEIALDGPLKGSSLNVIEKEIKLGHSVCLMLPTSLTPLKRKVWEERVRELQDHFTIPLVSIHIMREKAEERGVRALRFLFEKRIVVAFSSIN